jgi:hypothetical protein
VPNLPVPVIGTEIPGNFVTSASYNVLGNAGLEFALNVPIATLYQNTTQSLTSSANTAITLDGESLDTYGGHSTSTNNSRYTAQVPGYYLVYGVVVFATNATGWRACTIAKNGSASAVPGAFGIYQTTSSALALSAAPALGIIQMNGTTDYVEIYADQNSGGPLATAVAATIQQSCMSVWWMHA